jgi:hypothetical protein
MKVSSRWYTDKTRKLQELEAHYQVRWAGERMLTIGLYTSDPFATHERLDIKLTHAEAMGLVSQLCEIVGRKMIQDERKEESKP